MSPVIITIIILISTVVFYLIFLGLGIGGIAKNRRAQGIDKDIKNE